MRFDMEVVLHVDGVTRRNPKRDRFCRRMNRKRVETRCLSLNPRILFIGAGDEREKRRGERGKGRAVVVVAVVVVVVWV